MEFINQVKKLKDQTQSKEIKDLCESYLSGNLNVSKEQFQNMLKESQTAPSNYRDVIKNEEMETSKKIAQSLMESWNGLGGNKNLGNSGSYLKNQELSNNVSNISESKSNYVYSTEKKDSLSNMGILESIESLKKSPVYQFPAIKILCEKYSHLILNLRVPEFKLINSFVAETSSFKWDDSVNKIFNNLSEKAEIYSREIEVSNVLEALKNSGSYSFYSELGDTLNEWLNSDNKSSGLLAKNITKFSFNPIVRNLVNYLQMDESSDRRKLEIPSYNRGESGVSRIYSPVAVYEDKTLFAIGNTVFEASELGLKKLNKVERESVKDEDFNSIINALSSSNVRVNENGIFVNFGKKSVRLIEESEDISVYLDKTKLNFRTLGELAKLLSLESSSYLGMNENAEISNIINLYKGYRNIVELDFAKSINSNIYEGATINIMKWNDQLYLQRINESMRENSIFKVNGSQAVKMVKDFLRFDISEGLTEFLEGENKVKSVMINDRTRVIENIQLVESEISKLDTLISTNPLYASSKQILEAKYALEMELDNLKEKWSQINSELAKIDSSVSPELDILEDEKFNIGNYIKIKESGETGKIISIDGASGRYTVLLDNGKTSDYMVNELMDMEDAFNSAENDYEDEDYEEVDDYAEDSEDEDYDDSDDDEEVKEANNFNKSELSIGKQKQILKELASNHSFSKAPQGNGEKIKMEMSSVRGYNLTMNEGNGKTPLAKAPGNSKMASGKDIKKGELAKAPGSGKMSKGKELGKNLLDYKTHGTKGKIDFDAEDAEDDKYDIGYNLKEGTDSNLSTAPEKGKTAKDTSGMTNKPGMVEAPTKGKGVKFTSGMSNDPEMTEAPTSGKTAKATSGMTNKPGMVEAPTSGKTAKATSGMTNKPGMVEAPTSGKTAKATSGMSNDPRMVKAPGSGKFSNIKPMFSNKPGTSEAPSKGKYASETPYKSGDLTKKQNLSESEEVKKK